MSALQNTEISLYALLSECSRLALLAGRVIFAVHQARLLDGNAILNGHLKEIGDCKSVATVADVKAQRLIVNALRLGFPGICIVGEEEEDESISSGDLQGEAALGEHPFIVSGCLNAVKEKDVMIRTSEVVVYIDPLDGTHEFVEGRVEHVQTLIGIAVNGTPLAGVVGLPFWEQHLSTETRGLVDISRSGTGGAVIAGVTGVGTFGYSNGRPPSCRAAESPGIRIAASSSMTQPALVAVQNVLTAAPYFGSLTVVPACGNKILSLLLGECEVAAFNLKTSLWDACATQALLVAAGGRMTDLTGCGINYCHPSIARGGFTGNPYGVVATCAAIDHAALVQRIRQCPEVTALLQACGIRETIGGSATDVCRDTFGLPITVDTLSAVVGAAVESYTCPELEAHRYLMSEAARLHLSYKHGSQEPRSLFYKRAVMRALPHVETKMRTAPSKLARDVQSYLVEVSFLASSSCQLMSKSGAVKVAHCLKAEVYPCESAIDSRFSMLLEDFSPALGWYQTPMMNTTQLIASIQALAKFHAFFWNGGIHNKLLSEADITQLRQAVWPVATHWAPSRQPPEVMAQIADIWIKNNYFDPEVGFGDGSDRQRRLGIRLQQIAQAIAGECHFDTSDGKVHPHHTVIHGDAKSGNFFLRDGQGVLEIGLIDFQWCGFGLGATDLAYFIASCASSAAVDHAGDKEAELLRIYHSALVAAADEFKLDGAGKNGPIFPSLDELQGQYETGLLDVCRIAFSYHWGRIKASPSAFDAIRQKMLGPCAYNKDPNVARWLVVRCDNLLAQRGLL